MQRQSGVGCGLSGAAIYLGTGLCTRRPWFLGTVAMMACGARSELFALGVGGIEFLVGSCLLHLGGRHLYGGAFHLACSKPAHRDWHRTVRRGAVAKLAPLAPAPALNRAAVEYRARVVYADVHTDSMR